MTLKQILADLADAKIVLSAVVTVAGIFAAQYAGTPSVVHITAFVITGAGAITTLIVAVEKGFGSGAAAQKAGKA